MIRIVCVDDDIFSLRLLTELIEKAANKLDLNIEVSCAASSGEEAITFLNANPGSFLCFFDLEIGENHINGIDLAKAVHKISIDNKIVFVTSHGEKTLDILKSSAEPFGFIEKNVNLDMMESEFLSYLRKYSILFPDQDNESLSSETISLPVGIDEFINIEKTRITYIEALKNLPHHICWHTIDGSSITVRDTLENALSQAGEQFSKCHRSYIVNRQFIIGCDRSSLKLSNGEFVPCSTRLRKDFKK